MEDTIRLKIFGWSLRRNPTATPGTPSGPGDFLARSFLRAKRISRPVTGWKEDDDGGAEGPEVVSTRKRRPSLSGVPKWHGVGGGLDGNNSAITPWATSGGRGAVGRRSFLRTILYPRPHGSLETSSQSCDHCAARPLSMPAFILLWASL